MSFIEEDDLVKFNRPGNRKTYFTEVTSDGDGDGTYTYEPFVFNTTGIKSVKINGEPMADFVPRTVTKTTQTFEDILEATTFNGNIFYETTDDGGNTIYLMNDPKSSSLYIDPDSKFVFGDDFDIDEYYVMLFAKLGFIPLVSDNYPLSQIVGTQSDLIINDNTFELSENFKTQLKEYQAMGVNPVAIPYRITDPYTSNYVLETVKVSGTTQIIPTAEMFKETTLEVNFDGETFTSTLPIAEVEFEFDDPNISPFIFATELNTRSGFGCLLGVDKDFYEGLDRIPCGSRYNYPMVGVEMNEGVLELVSRKYKIPNTVTEIGNYAFAGNFTLKKITLPESVTKIGHCAFYGCESLKSLKIPASVTSLGENAFDGCFNLSSITCYGEVAPKDFVSLSWEEYGPIPEKGILYHPKEGDYTNWLYGLGEGWVSKAIEDGTDTTDKNRYLCFEPVEDGLTISMINQEIDLYYKVDNGDWEVLSPGSTTPSFRVGQRIYFKGDVGYDYYSGGIGTFVFNKKVKADGPVESLVGQFNYSWNPLCYLFKDCHTLVQAPKFACRELWDRDYYGMFENCTSLTEAPELPSTILGSYCYYAMFRGCTSLKKAPKLPATKMADFCYAFMFDGCTSLVEAPELPSKELAISCYNEMFMNCTSLVEAPELPAGQMQDSCYFGMFVNCINLTTAPVLNAKKLARLCYGFMFQNCTSLVNVPEVLPATTLADSCYQAMFLNCTSMTTAPKLVALNLVGGCYLFMFQNCYSLNYINARFLTTPSDYYTQAWVSEVNGSGTFVKNPNASWNITGVSGIPSDWVVEYSE